MSGVTSCWLRQTRLIWSLKEKIFLVGSCLIFLSSDVSHAFALCFTLLTFPIFITVAVAAPSAASQAGRNILPVTMNYCSVTCECSFPCCELVQHLHSPCTPLIFSWWEAVLWLLRISCIFVAFQGFWGTPSSRDRAAVPLHMIYRLPV